MSLMLLTMALTGQRPMMLNLVLQIKSSAISHASRVVTEMAGMKFILEDAWKTLNDSNFRVRPCAS